MKKSIVLFTAITVMAFSNSFSQEASKKVKAKSPSKTVIAPKVEAPTLETAGMAFEQETIDYGTVEFKADGGREFVFTNNGTKPLIITNCAGSCGCTVPTWPREPIAPGAKGVIAVKYATDRPGAFTKTVTVTANIAETAKVLTIKGIVSPDASQAVPGTIAPATKI
jgi:hypothetical protein